MKLAVLMLLLAAPVLQTVEVTLPDDEAQFSGLDADLLNANCVACHSPAMVLQQPRMTAEAWAHSVHKMRVIYKAPISGEDAAKLPDALVKAQAQNR